MSDYGAHPTQYGNLSDGNLYAMYRESVYRSLSESQKLDLLQETVNRDARRSGLRICRPEPTAMLKKALFP